MVSQFLIAIDWKCFVSVEDYEDMLKVVNYFDAIQAHASQPKAPL